MAGDTNYTLYYNVLNYLKGIMKNHPSINYVSQGDVFSIDTTEFPQYPIGNVIITNAIFDGKSTDYSVQIVVADKTKLKGNESSGSYNSQTIEFEGVDDTVDVHANTLSIINDLISFTDRKEEGFEVNGTVNCTAFKQRFDNGLAGWGADFTLRVHNDRNYCLFDLNPADDVSAYKVENCATSASFYVTFTESVPEGSGSFWSNDIEGDYQSYNIVGLESIETEELDFQNITPIQFRTYNGQYVNYKWFTDCDDANTTYTYLLVSLVPTTATYLDANGDLQTATGISLGPCAIGIIDLGGFAISNIPLTC
jgi:hypothetical protein